jgi:hypothetical protein
MNPYVFFVGCPRSGTTLLRRIGDAHPRLALVRPELHWLAAWWERRAGMTQDGTVTPELVDKLVAHSSFPKLELGADRVAALVGGRPKQYARFVTELFDLYGRAKGKSLVGNKTPQHVLHLSTLHELWPHARIVHLVRDGRDVALSVLDWQKARHHFHLPPWDEDPVMAAALFWERHVRLGREAALLDDRYYETRYESLVADPELGCRKLCDFLGLEYDSAMLRFHEGRTRHDPGLSAKKAWLPITAGLRSWREQMHAGQIARFEALAGDLLAELGYERAAPAASEEDLARAARFRDAFTGKARSKGGAVPRAWEPVTA